jgi:hypothetical protein
VATQIVRSPTSQKMGFTSSVLSTPVLSTPFQRLSFQCHRTTPARKRRCQNQKLACVQPYLTAEREFRRRCARTVCMPNHFLTAMLPSRKMLSESCRPEGIFAAPSLFEARENSTTMLDCFCCRRFSLCGDEHPPGDMPLLL